MTSETFTNSKKVFIFNKYEMRASLFEVIYSSSKFYIYRKIDSIEKPSSRQDKVSSLPKPINLDREDFFHHQIQHNLSFFFVSFKALKTVQ